MSVHFNKQTMQLSTHPQSFSAYLFAKSLSSFFASKYIFEAAAQQNRNKNHFSDTMKLLFCLPFLFFTIFFFFLSVNLLLSGMKIKRMKTRWTQTVSRQLGINSAKKRESFLIQNISLVPLVCTKLDMHTDWMRCMCALFCSK